MLHQYGVKHLPRTVSTDISLNALDAHGQPNNTQDLATENGISTENRAEQIVRSVLSDKGEVILGKGLSDIAPLMKRLSPSLVVWVNRRAFR